MLLFMAEDGRVGLSRREILFWTRSCREFIGSRGDFSGSNCVCLGTGGWNNEMDYQGLEFLEFSNTGLSCLR